MMQQARCPYPHQLPAPELAPGSTIKVIGLGGVGSIVARYLAVFLAALDRALRLVLVDGDSFTEANAARQLFVYGGNKAEAVRQELLDRFGGSNLRLEAIPEYVTPENAQRLIREQDIVLAAVDNHKTRLLLNDRCRELEDVTLISGGNDGVGDGERGTMGSIQVYIRRERRDVTPPLTHYHPEIAKPDDRRPDEIDCMEALETEPQLLFTNMMTATCILNALMLHVCGDALHYSELSFDVADGVMRPVSQGGVLLGA